MSDALDLYVAARMAFLDRPDVRLCTRPLFNQQAVTIYAADEPPARSWASATVSEGEMARDPDRQLVELIARSLRETFDRRVAIAA